MPVQIKKVDGYRVSTPNKVHAKNTTKEKAEAQAHLLRGIEHGWKPTGKPAKTGNALRDAVMGGSSAVGHAARAKMKKRK